MATQQSLDALVLANETRFRARDIKKAIREGEMSIRTALSHPHASGIRVNKLLESQHRWGAVKTRKLIVRRLGFNTGVQYAKVEELSPRQKALIAQGVEDKDFWVLEAGLRQEAL